MVALRHVEVPENDVANNIIVSWNTTWSELRAFWEYVSTENKEDVRPIFSEVM